MGVSSQRLDRAHGTSAGSARRNNLDWHVESCHKHVRPYVCPIEGCKKQKKGYSRNFDLQEHIEKTHPEHPDAMKRKAMKSAKARRCVVRTGSRLASYMLVRHGACVCTLALANIRR